METDIQTRLSETPDNIEKGTITGVAYVVRPDLPFKEFELGVIKSYDKTTDTYTVGFSRTVLDSDPVERDLPGVKENQIFIINPTSAEPIKEGDIFATINRSDHLCIGVVDQIKPSCIWSTYVDIMTKGSTQDWNTKSGQIVKLISAKAGKGSPQTEELKRLSPTLHNLISAAENATEVSKSTPVVSFFSLNDPDDFLKLIPDNRKDEINDEVVAWFKHHSFNSTPIYVSIVETVKTTVDGKETEKTVVAGSYTTKLTTGELKNVLITGQFYFNYLLEPGNSEKKVMSFFMMIDKEKAKFKRVAKSVLCCAFDATNDFLGATVKGKLHSTDRDWYIAHPLTVQSGLPYESTFSVLNDLVRPYGLGIKRAYMRKNQALVGKEDILFWTRILGVNPGAATDRNMNNSEYVQLMGAETLEMMGEDVSNYNFEFTDTLPEKPLVIMEGGFKGVGYASGGGHASYKAPRAHSNTWELALEYDWLPNCKYHEQPVELPYEDTANQELDFDNSIFFDDKTVRDIVFNNTSSNAIEKGLFFEPPAHRYSTPPSFQNRQSYQNGEGWDSPHNEYYDTSQKYPKDKRGGKKSSSPHQFTTFKKFGPSLAKISCFEEYLDYLCFTESEVKEYSNNKAFRSNNGTISSKDLNRGSEKILIEFGKFYLATHFSHFDVEDACTFESGYSPFDVDELNHKAINIEAIRSLLDTTVEELDPLINDYKIKNDIDEEDLALPQHNLEDIIYSIDAGSKKATDEAIDEVLYMGSFSSLVVSLHDYTTFELFKLVVLLQKEKSHRYWAVLTYAIWTMRGDFLEAQMKLNV